MLPPPGAPLRLSRCPLHHPTPCPPQTPCRAAAVHNLASQVYHDTPLFRGFISFLERGLPPAHQQPQPQLLSLQSPRVPVPQRSPTVLAHPPPQLAPPPHRRMPAPPAAALRRSTPRFARGPGKGYRYCESCNHLNHVRRSSCTSCGRPKPLAPAASRNLRNGGVRKRRRASLPARPRNIAPIPAPQDDRTPSLVSVHLGSGVLSELEPEVQRGAASADAVVDCTQLAEVSSCTAALSDVTSKSVRESSFPDERVRKEESWDAPIGDDEFGTDLVDESGARTGPYAAQETCAGQSNQIALEANPPQPNLDEMLLCDFVISDEEILAPSEMPESAERGINAFPLPLLDGFLPAII